MSNLEKIGETRNYLSEEIKHNDLMSERRKTTCKYLNYVEYLLILAATVTGCVLKFEFTSIVCVPVGLTSSAVGLKICAITACKCKTYKWFNKKKKKKHNNIVLLGKTKLDTIKVLISKALVDSCISYDKFVSVNNILRQYNGMKEEIKHLETSVEYII